MEVFGGCNYTCQMCPQTNLVEEKVYQKNAIIEFERILMK